MSKLIQQYIESIMDIVDQASIDLEGEDWQNFCEDLQNELEDCCVIRGL